MMVKKYYDTEFWRLFLKKSALSYEIHPREDLYISLFIRGCYRSQLLGNIYMYVAIVCKNFPTFGESY